MKQNENYSFFLGLLMLLVWGMVGVFLFRIYPLATVAYAGNAAFIMSIVSFYNGLAIIENNKENEVKV